MDRERVMRSYWYIPTAVLLVLVIVGVLAGWVQLSLGPDTWAVPFTTSRGFEKSVIRPSGFTWRWERLVPHAFTLYRITVGAEKADMEVKAVLPSAETYSSLMPDKPDFSIDIKLSAMYRIRPDALPELVGSEGLRQENLGDWHDQMNSEIQRRATEIAMGMAGAGAGTDAAPGDTEPGSPAAVSAVAPGGAASLSQAIIHGLTASFPKLEFLSIAPVVVKMPDPQLYQKLRSAYLAIIDQREKALSRLVPQQVADEVSRDRALAGHEASIAILTKYGELLAKYPALIKFLFLTTSQKLTPKDLQTLDLLDKLGGLE